MRNMSISIALALAAAGSVLLGGTAQAATANNCVSYTIVNGHLVQTTGSCKASATGTNGSSSSSSSSSSNGTSTPGKTTNNCVPVSSCTASAKGTGGTGH